MARRYDCMITWHDKGNRFQRSAAFTTEGSNARIALNKAMDYAKRYAKRTWRECEGGIFTARVIVGPVINKPEKGGE